MSNQVVFCYTDFERIGNMPKKFSSGLTLPLSLLPLAYYLRKEGYQVKILDTRCEDYKEYDFSDAICVGFSVMTGPQITNSLEIAKYLRQKYGRHLTFIWGGVHPSLTPDQTAKNDYVDIVVRGEGEEIMLQLVKALDRGLSIEGIKGITYKKGSEVISNPDSPFIDMNNLGLLPYDSLKLERYFIKERLMYNSSRGCPHSCKFCYNLAFNQRCWRSYDATVVVNQIDKFWHRFGFKVVDFYEDNFFANKRRVEEICQGLIDRKIDINWYATCRFDYFSKYDTSFLSLLRKSGCYRLAFGAESGDEEILSKIEKGISIEQILITVKKCKEFDITPVISFIFAFPGETEGNRKHTFILIDKIINIYDKAEINGIFMYTPFPGTPLYQEAIQHGFQPPSSLEEWARFEQGNAINTPWLSKNEFNRLSTILQISRMPFYTDQLNLDIKLKREGDFLSRAINVYKRISYAFYYIFWLSARYRWKCKFFSFPIEWKIWKFFKKLKGTKGV